MNANRMTGTAPADGTSYLTRPGGRIGYDMAGSGPLMRRVLLPAHDPGAAGRMAQATGQAPAPATA